MKLLLLVFTFPMVCCGQIVLNKQGEQIGEELIFNAEFIRLKKIKSINGRFTYKRTGSVMRETSYWQVFEFDTLGRILQSYETRKDDGTMDTVWTKYFYNDKGLLIYQSTGTHEFFDYRTSVYNSERQLIAVEDFRRKADGFGIPIVAEEHVERYSYEEIDGSLVQTKINKQGTPYSKKTPFYSAENQLIREEERYLVTNEGLIHNYRYDSKGNLLEKQTLTSKQGIKKETYSFKYDEKGNLIEKKHLLEDKLKTEIQYLHSEISGLLSAILYQDMNSPSIIILRIKEYEFY